MKLKNILPSIIIGNMFEWYDFSLYGYMATTIAQLFFPTVMASFALMTTFTVFLVGFIARPVGAVIFGYYADKLGRKTILSISILLMAFSTSLIGLLPTYAAIGISASVFLILCRIIQGFAIGGEFTLSVTYLIEHAPMHKKGLFGSCTMLGTFIGLFLGSISITILNIIFSQKQVIEYAWRIPFIISLLLGILGFIIRSNLPETPAFEALVAQELTLKNPVQLMIKNSYRQLLIAIGVVGLGACNFWLWFTWLPFYLKIYTKLSASYILFINSSNLLVITIIIPLIGFLSDKIGSRLILAIAALGTIVFVLPLLWLMSNFSLYAIELSQLGLAILTGIVYGVVPITLFKLFPANIRCSGISLSYNIANLIFGGTMPLLASFLLIQTNHLIYQGIVVIIAALIIVLLLPTLKEQQERPEKEQS